MQHFKLLILLYFFDLSFQAAVFKTFGLDELSKNADSKIGFPWSPKGITLAKTSLKEEGTLVISCFGSVSSGKQWRLLNGDEIKEKWGIETLNLNEEKSAPYLMLDNISGSREMTHTHVWKFLFKAGKVPNTEESVLIKLAYGTSITGNFDQQANIKVIIVPSNK